MSEHEIYQELFSKIQEKKGEVQTNDLDSFKVSFLGGDTILKTWVRFKKLEELFAIFCPLHT